MDKFIKTTFLGTWPKKTYVVTIVSDDLLSELMLLDTLFLAITVTWVVKNGPYKNDTTISIKSNAQVYN